MVDSLLLFYFYSRLPLRSVSKLHKREGQRKITVLCGFVADKSNTKEMELFFLETRNEKSVFCQFCNFKYAMANSCARDM